MKTSNKISALMASLCIGFFGVSTLAQAQGSASSYPSAPIKIIVGYSAGGPTDLAARLIATKLQVALGQSVLVENRAGAGSNLASELVARAAPDGLTLLMAAAPLAVNGHLYKNLKFDVLTSFAPISQVMAAPSILAVPPNSAKTMAELIALARKEPGKLSFSSSGAGGTQHLAGELLQQKAGIKLIHIPYKGASPALNDLLGGRVSMGFMTSLGSVPYFKDGRLRPLAVASATRLPQLPDVPTMAEVGFPSVEIDSWSGLLAPANTPPAIVEKLQREVAKALASPDVNGQLTSQGAVVVGSTPAAFRAFLANEHSNYGALIRSIHIELN
jgi:tripartite-type tricarboxylate transporter receptor subunit TctC